MSKELKVTDKTSGWLDWCVDNGAYDWVQNDYGITVPSDVSAAIEGLTAVLAGASVQVSRDNNNRISQISFSNIPTQLYDEGVEAFEDAVDSYEHEQIDEGENYNP